MYFVKILSIILINLDKFMNSEYIKLHSNTEVKMYREGRDVLDKE